MSAQFTSASFNIVRRESRDGICFPADFVLLKDTGLPPDARWARFDEEGNVIEEYLSEQDAGNDGPGDDDDSDA